MVSFKRLVVVLSLAVPALSGCNGCDDGLSETPKPNAELKAADKTTPPEDHLTVAMPAAVIGLPVSMEVTLSNKGDANLDVSNIVFSRDNTLCPSASGNFVIQDPAPQNGKRAVLLPPGQSKTITVKFTPSNGAPECSVLQVLSNDGDTPTLKALFTGKGDAAGLCAERTLIDFGDLEVGHVGDDVIHLTSCGTRDLVLTSITGNSFFPPFESENVVLPVTLAPTAVLDIPVHFRPTEPGVWTDITGHAGQLTITSGDGTVYQISLNGRSHLPPSCLLDAMPAAINFGLVADMAPRSQDVVLLNRGDAPCTLSALEVTPGGSPFGAALLTGMVGDTLAPQTSTTVHVTWTAPATTGVYNAVLGVTSNDPLHPHLEVPLEANYPGEVPCLLEVDPNTVNFGAVPLNTFSTRVINLRNAGTDTCFISGVRIEPGSNSGFVNTASSFAFIPAGGTKTVSVSFRPMQSGSATGRLKITGGDAPFGGAHVDYFVQLVARTGTTGICVEPRHLAFGDVTGTATQSFTVSACGAQSVTVNSLEWTQPDAEFALDGAAGTPFTLVPGDARTFTVRYSPVDAQGDTAIVTVRSDDGVNPALAVDMTGGHEVVPLAAGRFLYFWQIPNVTGGDVVKFPLQGNTTPTPFWGPRTGRACAGCHSVSPDGRYVAVLELATMRFVEADTGAELILNNRFADPQYFSWRPDVGTNPPYQFAYGTGGIVKIAAMFDGALRDLQGANDPNFLQTMPSWGSNGKIAFVKGQAASNNNMQQQQNGATGFQGPTDIMVVDENGGTPTAVTGASANTKANYYPQFSPNGHWISFTQSDSAQTTVSASDARLRLVRSDGTGTVLQWDALNGNTGDGANSYATWAVDGTFVSFSSNRAGGAGDWDIYVAPINPLTGADGPAQNLTDLNTSAFEHAAQWAP